jgi:uncharacterized membrane protein YdfJ with MMPL/SSD domain
VRSSGNCVYDRIFSVLVLIFHGRFQDLLRYTSRRVVGLTEPVLLFAIVFGLSTDYCVFLLTRTKVAHDAGMPIIARRIEGMMVTIRWTLSCPLP